MIDLSMYKKMHEHAIAFAFRSPQDVYPLDHLPTYLSIEQHSTETDLLLMPPEIHGFYLNEKKWIQLFVEDISPID